MTSELLGCLIDYHHPSRRLKTHLGLELRLVCIDFFVLLMVYPFLWTVSHLNTCLEFGVHFTTDPGEALLLDPILASSSLI